jgi:hypothetical protein
LRFRPNKIRVEILLPLFYKDGTEIEKSKFLETREELAAKFIGCTALTPAEGLWIDKDSTKYYDVNSGFYVVAPYREDSIGFFEDYKTKLKKRFDQREIFIIYYPVKNVTL